MTSRDQTPNAGDGNDNPSAEGASSVKTRSALHLLPHATQDTLEQIVASVIENEDEAKRKSLIVNLIQFAISINQADQSESLYPSPELLSGYQKVDQTIVQRLLALTEETIKHDMALEARQADAEISLKQQQVESEGQLKHRQLDAQIDLNRQEQLINKNLDENQLESDIKIRNQGQWMAFGIAALSFGAAIYAFSQGNAVAAAIVSFFGVATTIIGAFLRFRPVRQSVGKSNNSIS